MFTKEMLDDYANKLLFDLTEDENKLLISEFDVIKENMEIISNIEGIEKVKPLSFPQEVTTDHLRSDDTLDLLTSEEALSNCHDKMEDVAIVPKVVG